MILHQNSPPPPLLLPRLLPSCLLFFFLLPALLLSPITSAFEQCDPKFTEELLRGHNYFRAHHNAGTLSLNASISKWSQSWADYLLTSGTFQHRFSSENLFYQVTSDHQYRLSGDLPVSNWYNELLNYPFFGSEPNLVTLPHWKHLTAMLWAASTDIGVGCSTTVVVDGYGQASRVTLVVVNYWPEGNVVGAFAENVRQPRTTGYPNAGHQQQNPQQYPNYPPSPGSPIQSKPPQYQSHHLPQQQQPQYQQPQQNHPQYQPANPVPNPQPPEYLNIQSDQNPAEYLANPAYPPSITYHKPPPPPTTYQTTTPTTTTTTTTTAKPTTTTSSTTRKPYQTSSRKPAYSVPLKPIISSAAAAISSAGSAASATYHHPALPDLQELYDLEEAFSDFDDDRKKSGGAKKSGGSDEGLLTKTKSNSAKAVSLAQPVKSPSSKVSSETKEK